MTEIDPQLLELHKRYKNGDRVFVLASEIGLSDTGLKKRFRKAGLKLNPIGSAPGAPRKAPVKNVYRPVTRHCGNCRYCHENCLTSKRCIECYDVKGEIKKPNFSKKSGL